MVKTQTRVGSTRGYEVYVLRGKVGGATRYYVGQGFTGRSKQHLMPCRWPRIGFTRKPTVVYRVDVATREDALQAERKLIQKYPRKLNKSLGITASGLRPWNKGLTKATTPALKGGRPVGIPMSKEAKLKLSNAMKGRATAWLRGKKPWNFGLTKKTHPALMKSSIQMRGNKGGFRKA